MPPALAQLRRKLGSGDAVEAAIREALDASAASDEVILNISARQPANCHTGVPLVLASSFHNARSIASRVAPDGSSD